MQRIKPHQQKECPCKTWSAKIKTKKKEMWNDVEAVARQSDASFCTGSEQKRFVWYGLRSCPRPGHPRAIWKIQKPLQKGQISAEAWEVE